MLTLMLAAALATGGGPDAAGQHRQARRAARAAPSTANYDAVMRHSYYGRGCPQRAQPRSIADWEQPLQFILLPSGGRGKILIVGGHFTAGDGERLRSFLASAGPITEVQFDSGGGDAAEGPKVGRVIRAARLSTRVAGGFACISSCSMAFLGGVVRRVDRDAVYGIHAFFDKNFLEGLAARSNPDAMRNFLHAKEQTNAILAGQIQEYGQEMGISRLFFTDIMFAQRSEIFIADDRLGQLRAQFTRPLTSDQAFTTTEGLIKEGVLRFQTDDDKQEVKDLMAWMTQPHTQDEVDGKLASILSNEFRCLPPDQLDRYNITNVISR